MTNTAQWRNLFVVFDDGLVTIAQYEKIEPKVSTQAAEHAQGLLCLVVIPESAVPPPAAVRAHLERMLARLPIRALGYVVEGQGFKAAAVRAVLLGLGVFQRKSYSTKVFTGVPPALSWLFEGAELDARAARQAIDAARAV